jgi:hypothetical protein
MNAISKLAGRGVEPGSQKFREVLEQGTRFMR